MTETKTIALTINGRGREVAVLANATLLETLRELGNFEVKSGCEKGDCGACAVLVDGEALDSCLVLSWTVAGRAVTTVAGLSRGAAKHPLVEAFENSGAVQCGYCTPGMVMQIKHILALNPDPDEAAIRRGLEGNICRCTGYSKIIDAVKSAAQMIRTE